MIIPKQKIKVFISSACGDDPDRQKYNLVRAGLKALIESTYFAEVYLFEGEGASTASAGQHYTYALEDCDVCIFLIDNKDGIPNGVQVEIDTVKKCGIKALYYFCDQSSIEQTPLQKSLKGAKYAKSKTVHSFEEFVENGAIDLIEDLVMMYKHYCKGRISWKEEDSTTNKEDISIDKSSAFSDSVAQKDVLTHIDCCKNYFSQLIIGYPKKELSNTSEMDKLCSDFLPVLFGGVKIHENSNIDLLKKEIKRKQSSSHFLVTDKRYEAIQAYFSGDLDECVSKLEEALKIAKTQDLPTWIIKDILVDLRGQGGYLEESKNRYLFDGKYQKELDNSDSLLYYPMIDRFDSNLYEKFAGDGIKYKIQSPNTITMGHNLNTYTDVLASTFVLAMYNGSLTHLHILYRRIMTMSFYLAERYSDWNLKIMLLKTSIIDYKTKEIEGVTRYFADILGKLNAVDAKEICVFADNRPIAYQRFCAKLEAFRITGYFLSDEEFANLWGEIYKLIIDWIKNDNSPITVGGHIFSAIEGTYLRIKQDQLVEIMCECIEHRMRRFYDEVFKVLSKCIILNEVSPEITSRFLTLLIGIVCDENERKHINYLHLTLCRVRKQNKELTEELDKAICKNMFDFYQGNYQLETTENKNKDMPAFVREYVQKIKERNDSQGIGGVFSEYGDQPYETIKSIIKFSGVKFSSEIIDTVFEAACETLMKETQNIESKMNAINLIIFLIKTYPDLQERNKTVILELLTNKEVIENGSAIMSNLNEANLRFCALLLYSCLGEDVNTDIIEILVDIGDDTLSQIKASQQLLSYLEADNKMLNSQMESIILQHSIKWCNDSNRDVRWNAIMILFQLLRNPNNKNIVSNQLVKSIDIDNVYIKTSILRMVYKIQDVDMATYDYIMQKATIDTNFVVRKVAGEVGKENRTSS